MKVIYGIGKAKKNFKNPVLAIGVFDGVHLGHRYLIQKINRQARAMHGTSMVMTFFPHPMHVLKPSTNLPLLVSLRHRLKLIESLGVDVCVVVNFTNQFSHLNADGFIKQYIVDFVNPREIWIGQNFRFGKSREGDIRLLREFEKTGGFKVHGIAPRRIQGDVVSSTRIRKLILAGKIVLAARLLGRPFSIFGKVIRGDGRGSTLGFPTANINPLPGIIAPCGVYMVEVVIAGHIYQGMANIGRRPSFYRKRNSLKIEAHIFNFRVNIYHKEIEIRFLKKIRNEKKFDSNEKLTQQLNKDEEMIRTLFLKISKPAFPAVI